MKTMGILLAAAAALTLAACASDGAPEPTPAGDRDCFNADSVRGYNLVDENHVDIRVGANRHYVLTTDWNARDLDWTHAIAIRSTSGFICTGNGLGVELIGGDPRRTYHVTNIARAPDEVPNSDVGS